MLNEISPIPVSLLSTEVEQVVMVHTGAEFSEI